MRSAGWIKQNSVQLVFGVLPSVASAFAEEFTPQRRRETTSLEYYESLLTSRPRGYADVGVGRRSNETAQGAGNFHFWHYGAEAYGGGAFCRINACQNWLDFILIIECNQERLATRFEARLSSRMRETIKFVAVSHFHRKLVVRLGRFE
jgi:hypothetical protein